MVVPVDLSAQVPPVATFTSPNAAEILVLDASLSPEEVQFLQQLWDAIDYGIFILEVIENGQDFRYVKFNATMTRTSPIPVDYLLGKTVREALPPTISDICLRRYQACFNSAQTVSFEEHFELEGNRVWWLLTVKPLCWGTAGIQQLIATAVDITAQKEIEAEIGIREAKFRRFVENADDLIYEVDAAGNFTYLSPQFKTMYGYEVKAFLRKSFVSIVHPDDLTRVAASNQHLLLTGERQSGLEFRTCRRDGSSIWIVCNNSPIKNELGQVIGFHGIARDVSDRKVAEAQLQEQTRYKTLLSHIANQICNALSLNTVIETTIHALHELLELDYCGFGWFHPNGAEPIWEIIMDARPEGFPSYVGKYPASLLGSGSDLLIQHQTIIINDSQDVEDPVFRALLDSSNIKSDVTLPIRTAGDRIGLLFCLYSQKYHHWSDPEIELLNAIGSQVSIAIDQADLYAQTRAKSQKLEITLQELRRTQAQMVHHEKMSSLGQLVAGIAHEINNPVNFIHGNINYAAEYTQDLLGLIELYQKDYPNPTSAIADYIEEVDLEFLSQDLLKLLNSMKVGTERIREIVKSLRLFSRLDESDVKSVDIHESMDSTLMILQNRLKGKPNCPGIQVIKQYGTLPSVECYAGQLNQVFMNILANAIDALEERDKHRSIPEMEAHPSQITITTSLLEESDGKQWVEIAIADNGPGIPEDIQGRIFDPFFTTKPVGQGTGMGLSTSYQVIADKHQGSLTCSSTVGHGTELVIRIPHR
ncbi:PAS domain S-box protein [Alkalinema sp. FACHB-956]|uniref:PAS domain-containing sensor histidine kinase n=1 Tax=Alkalinema sp. FACHB-956 TaxID=2692768 RepID=UPI001683DE72|nr:PAS domain S-box protein [Alkalinema sp. FACHB-956]MBD2325636.1 PAS domain S-box protein [Alkalinema sp. FACHB-956]